MDWYIPVRAAATSRMFLKCVRRYSPLASAAAKLHRQHSSMSTVGVQWDWGGPCNFRERNITELRSNATNSFSLCTNPTQSH
jgi:hypothetical protein